MPLLSSVNLIYYGKEREEKKRKKQETGDHLLWQTCASCSLCYFKEHSGDSFVLLHKQIRKD